MCCSSDTKQPEVCSSKDRKPFLADLKEVYQASAKELAEQQLDKLEEKWGKKYSLVRMMTQFILQPLSRWNVLLICFFNPLSGI